ncbi:hypothetical protein AAF712_000625 [Marasmius tenuissimus]|uniref:B-block binding subunit of TFIIIC domain-containing protein n=1 Tax=Marasmius tenuissimus TaxID=585030 RepID=A0ABR3AFB0_9AGAR
MDELLNHCLGELAFDGDLGCSVSRLSTFVRGFYENHSSAHVQNVDDAFCAFVWSLIVQQPTVRVGLIPEGITSEVWIAPQTSAKRKANARGEAHVEMQPPELDIVADAKLRPLAELQAEYGDKLRIACDSDAIYASITGSHIRFSKLSPMVYSALQIITRGREKGVTVVELGTRSGYDQKTCFYLVKQLLELNLVVKRRHGGVGTHFVIHRYIFERSPSWKAIREEEQKAEQLQAQASEPKVEAEEEEQSEAVNSLDFPPLDARHLSSLPLVRARVVKLLKASKNNMHVSNNMLLTLGFSNPTKTDRRFFQSRIRDLVQQGVVEKVIVPSIRKKSTRASNVLCLRLVDENATGGNESGISPDLDQVFEEGDVVDAEELVNVSGVKMNATIHRQIIELLEDSGTRGMTLGELSTALDSFDKRTVELLLTRAEKVPPPSHLSDLGIAGLMETNGRERRYRYFTVSAYRTLVDRENLDKSTAGYSDADLSNYGNFLPVDASIFYDSEEALRSYQDCLRGDDSSKGKKGVGRPPKQSKAKKENTSGGSVSAIKPRQTRKRKFDEIDVNEDGSDEAEQPSKRTSRKGGEGEGIGESISAPAPRKRGRPPKNPDSTVPVPKKRGRPRKNATVEAETSSASQREHLSLPPRRGRSRMSVVPSQSDGEVDELAEEGATAEEDVDMSERGQPNAVDSIPRPMSLEPPPSVVGGAPVTGQSDADVEMGNGQNAQAPHPPDFAPPPLQPSPNEDDPVPLPKLNSHPSEVAPSLSGEPVKGKALVARTKVNVSGLRRENELLRVLELMGGIANVHSKELYDTHTRLVESLVKAGEPTSAPVGTRTDKRTVVGTFNSLESRGKVKQLTASVAAQLGINRSVVIAYLPTLEDAKLNEFLVNLGRVQPPPIPQAPGRKLTEPLEYGSEGSRVSKSAAPLQVLRVETPVANNERWSKNATRAEELSTLNDEAIRSVLLAERSTLGQLYGTIMARVLRVRELHMIALRAFESACPSREIVSHDKKIMTLTFLSHELPLADYCKIVPPVEYSEDVLDFLSTEEGPKTIVRDLPAQLPASLQIGRSRARTRLLDNLETLRALKLVTPLVPSTSQSPWLTCSSNGELPTAFDPAPLEGWNASTPMMAPNYWVFSNLAPLHHWARSETEPPFLCDMPTSSTPQVSVYWSLLRDACTKQTLQIPQSSSSESTTGPLIVNTSVARSLRRRVSWEAEYILTWHQTQYLKRFVDSATRKTPLDEEDADAKMKRIAWVICAPPSVVSQYYMNAQAKLVKELEKGRKRKRESTAKKEKQDREAKASLAKKAEEARRQREAEWDAIVEKVHPGPLQDAASARIKRLRTRFLQSTAGKDTQKWENEIIAAVQEAEMISKKVLKSKMPGNLSKKQTTMPNQANATGVLPVAANPPEKSVKDLIAEQGPPLAPKPAPPKKRKKSEKGKEKEAPAPENAIKLPLRRHRFQWNRDYEELARDACAIIKARCRDTPRLDWGAYEQVFPAVPRNTVRQRVAHIREIPANDTYLNRLEDRWYELWVQHRGTVHLPDHDPTSPTNFSLIEHIEFLRKHIDKNALRVGYAQPQQAVQVVLSSSLERLYEQFDVVESTPTAPTWDFVWNATVEEGREKPKTRRLTGVSVAESALKMVLSTPSELYDPERAAAMLHEVGEEDVSIATKGLLAQGVLSKLVRDPNKTRPGRQLKISDVNQHSLNGNLSRDLFQDAASLRELSAQQEGEWREWPLLATDGDCAALIQLVSDDKVDFRIDTSGPQSARPTLDWNSKKADDDNIETAVHVRFRDLQISGQSVDMDVDEPPPNPNLEATQGSTHAHGKTSTGDEGCCRLNNVLGIVNCATCLEESWVGSHDRFDQAEMHVAQLVLWLVDQAGEGGVTKEDLVINTKVPLDQLMPVLEKLVSESYPALYWVGYTTQLLVTPAYLKKWTVVVQEMPLMRTLPRRWVTTSGFKNMEIWEAGLRAVVGTVVFRPGISLYELRWRLRLVYDRQEVCDLLHALQENRIVKNRCNAPFAPPAGMLGGGLLLGLNESEEMRVFWFLEEAKNWFQL